jgi:glucose/arabinose dehydrogenase
MTMKNNYPPRLILAAMLAIGGLGACSRSEPEPEFAPETERDSGVTMNLPGVEPSAPATPLPAETDGNAAAEVPPETATLPDEQMLDDASATGMTARASRGEEAAPDEAPVANAEAE